MTSFKDYYHDPFSIPSTEDKKFIIGPIKPMYALLIDSMGYNNIDVDELYDPTNFKKEYEQAKKNLEVYMKDLLIKSQLMGFSKNALTIIVAQNNDSVYVLKGEFVLRVINDFKLNKIKLADKTFKEFKDFVENNTDYWSNSLIEIDKITINIGNSLEDYLFLMDRYEIYDETFKERLKTAQDIFIF